MKDSAAKQKEGILKEYDNSCILLGDFTEEIQTIVEKLFISPTKKVHAVQGRVKKKDSLEKKLNKPENPAYTRLDEINDVCGVRIITYFATDVPKIFEVLEKELEVIKSGDKGETLNHDQFGYLSFHCVVSLPAKRLLTENERFTGLKCEIQIRSILQHAWAEIEHGLNYKNTQVKVLPKQIQRPFSRLAGLLELGDSEFERIRKEVGAYELELERKEPGSLTNIPIDKNSVAAFIKKSEVSGRIDSNVFKRTQLNVVFSDTFVDAYVPRLEFLGISTIGELEIGMGKRSAFLTRFISEWYLSPAAAHSSLIPSGIGISFLCWAQVLEKNGYPAMELFVKKFAFNKNKDPVVLAGELCTAYDKAKQKPPGRKR